MATFGGVVAATREQAKLKRQPDWRKVPYELGEWKGIDAVSDPVYGADPADTSMFRLYRRGPQPPIIVYVGFYENLAAIMDVHTPELCYPASGWTIRSASRTSGGVFRGKPIAAQQIVTDKDGSRRLVTWWYNAGSRPFETRLRYVYAMWVMSMFTGRADGSIVRFETPVDASGETGAKVRLEDF
jgi:EpsI family protein